jgi:uncharacterized membrane protein YqhA
MLWQVIIHLTFVLSALILAWIDRLTFRAVEKGHAAPPLPAGLGNAAPAKP